MKRIIAGLAAASVALSFAAVLGGCTENVQETGNKIVSGAKDYLQSEAGINGDVNSLKDNAVSYLNEELGLNNSANKVIEGIWTQKDETNGDWEWTFDGTNKCVLKGLTTGFEGNGTYSVNEDERTVTVCMNEWDKEKVYTYKLTQTLSDTMLELTEGYSGYNLVKNK